ncbi:MAG: hypothetical protein V1773_05450 [bacterium]
MKQTIRDLLFFACLLFVFSGCGSMKTSKNHYKRIDDYFCKRNFDSAATVLITSKLENYGEKDRVLYWLDLGLLYHYQGDCVQSNLMLENAEKAIEDLYTSSISKGAASMLLNDNALDYSGEDYEDIYLNVFKSLNYLKLNKFDESFVEVRRINNKLILLEDKYKKVADNYNSSEDAKAEFKTGESKFHNSALGRYLSLLLYRAEGDMDGARIDKEKYDEAFTNQAGIYDFPQPVIDSLLIIGGLAKVNFISLTGKGPEKFARELIVHTDKDIIIIYYSDGKEEKKLDAIAWPGVEKGIHFKLSLPYMEKTPTHACKIVIEVDGKDTLDLEKVESIENAAQETYKLKEPIIYLKTITRTIIKAILNESANKELDKSTGGGLFGSLTRAVTGAVVDATENADLRLSRYFPSTASVGEIELEPGDHSIRIKYIGFDGSALFIDDLGTKNISRGGLNIFESFYLN